MQNSFTHQFMVENRGCYSGYELDSRSFMKNRKNGDSLILLKDILDSEIPLEDKFWFVCNKCATREENIKIAFGVCDIVIPFYERDHDNKLPREVFEAAKAFLNGQISSKDLYQKIDSLFYESRTTMKSAVYFAASSVRSILSSDKHIAYLANSAACLACRVSHYIGEPVVVNDLSLFLKVICEV